MIDFVFFGGFLLAILTVVGICWWVGKKIFGLLVK